MIDSWSFDSADWEDPNPEDARYWECLRAALCERYIQVNSVPPEALRTPMDEQVMVKRRDLIDAIDSGIKGIITAYADDYEDNDWQKPKFELKETHDNTNALTRFYLEVDYMQLGYNGTTYTHNHTEIRIGYNYDNMSNGREVVVDSTNTNWYNSLWGNFIFPDQTKIEYRLTLSRACEVAGIDELTHFLVDPVAWMIQRKKVIDTMRYICDSGTKKGGIHYNMTVDESFRKNSCHEKMVNHYGSSTTTTLEAGESSYYGRWGSGYHTGSPNNEAEGANPITGATLEEAWDRKLVDGNPDGWSFQCQERRRANFMEDSSGGYYYEYGGQGGYPHDFYGWSVNSWVTKYSFGMVINTPLETTITPVLLCTSGELADGSTTGKDIIRGQSVTSGAFDTYQDYLDAVSNFSMTQRTDFDDDSFGALNYGLQYIEPDANNWQYFYWNYPDTSTWWRTQTTEANKAGSFSPALVTDVDALYENYKIMLTSGSTECDFKFKNW